MKTYKEQTRPAHYFAPEDEFITEYEDRQNSTSFVLEKVTKFVRAPQKFREVLFGFKRDVVLKLAKELGCVETINDSLIAAQIARQIELYRKVK